jgi:hypothetical protein
LALAGWASSLSQVTLLKDGKEYGKTAADASAKFAVEIKDLPEGMYTFSLIGTDKASVRSRAYTSTFWIKEGSKTALNSIIIPPTISASKTNLGVGESVTVSGYTAPNATVDVWLEPQKGATSQNTVKTPTQALADGKWGLTIDTKGLPQGVYVVKARTEIKGTGYGDFSYAINIGLGQAVGGGTCGGADLNHDGKVNLIDFSILLYYWNTSNECADQNHDGKVNLIDFSIMLYNWTG